MAEIAADAASEFADYAGVFDAFKNSFNQSTARTTIVVNRKSPRKDELSIITVAYCFPIRAIDWMKPYKERYERFLNTGNPATDTGNAILLHSEGNGKQLPSLFAVDNAEEIAARAAIAAQAATNPQPEAAPMPQSGPAVPPPMPGAAPVPPPIAPQPEIKLFIAVAGQQYGPYNMDMCKQMVQGGQLTPQSMVWMEGMPAWAPASQVPVLQALFAPSAPAMPPLPPTGGPTPPPMM